jgi:hypothetical protein
MSLFAVIATSRMALLSLDLDARHREVDRFQFRHQAILRARELRPAAAAASSSTPNRSRKSQAHKSSPPKSKQER